MQLITQATGKVIEPAIAGVYIYLFCGCDYSQIVCMRLHMNTVTAVLAMNVEDSNVGRRVGKSAEYWDCSAVKELQCTISFMIACFDSKLSRANYWRRQN